MMALMIYVTFALNFWIPFDLVWYYIKQRYDPSKYWLWERVYRASFVIVITIIAVIFPAVTKFIGLVSFFVFLVNLNNNITFWIIVPKSIFVGYMSIVVGFFLSFFRSVRQSTALSSTN